MMLQTCSFSFLCPPNYHWILLHLGCHGCRVLLKSKYETIPQFLTCPQCELICCTWSRYTQNKKEIVCNLFGPDWACCGVEGPCNAAFLIKSSILLLIKVLCYWCSSGLHMPNCWRAFVRTLLWQDEHQIFVLQIWNTVSHWHLETVCWKQENGCTTVTTESKL